jgi:hypothetical protein
LTGACVSDEWLTEYVKSFGGTCPLCRAPLVAGELHCTRCRSELQLGLKVLELYLLAWGMALGATAVMAGFGLFLLLLILRRPHFRDAAETIIVLGNCFMGLMMALSTITLLVFRRRFCRLPRISQWVVAVFLAGAALVGVISFGMVVH